EYGMNGIMWYMIVLHVHRRLWYHCWIISSMSSLQLSQSQSRSLNNLLWQPPALGPHKLNTDTSIGVSCC
ncbi:hypothetical protein TorRG33x02_304610, partial [Trema orientale]